MGDSGAAAGASAAGSSYGGWAMTLASLVSSSKRSSSVAPMAPNVARAANTGPGLNSSGWTVNFGNGNRTGAQLPQSPLVYAALALGVVILWKLAK